MYYVYILQSLKDLRTYIGYSADVAKRLYEHNLGKVTATKHRKPFKLLHTEEFGNLAEAKKRELYWKSGAGRRKLKGYFSNGFPPIRY